MTQAEPTQVKHQSHFRLSSHLFLSQIFAKVFGIASIVASTYLLQAEGRGLIAMALLWSGALGTLGAFGADSALAMKAGKGELTHEEAFATSAGIALLSGILSSSLLLTVGWFFAEALYPGVSWPLILPGCLAVFFGVTRQVLRTYLVHFRRTRWIMISKSVSPLCLALTIVVSVLWIAPDAGLNGQLAWILWLQLLVSAGFFVGDFYALRRSFAFRAFHWRLALIGVSVGLPLGLNQVLAFAHNYIDQYLLAKLRIGSDGVSLVGIYTVAYAFFLLAKNFGHSSAAIMRRTASEMDAKDMQEFVATNARRVMLGSLIIALGLIALADLLIAIVAPPEFAPAAGVLRILSFALPPIALAFVMSIALAVKERYRVIFTINSIAVIANITLNVLLIPAYGLIGAAAATCASLLVQSTLLFFASSRQEGVAFAKRSLAVERSDLLYLWQKGASGLRKLRSIWGAKA